MCFFWDWTAVGPGATETSVYKHIWCFLESHPTPPGNLHRPTEYTIWQMTIVLLWEKSSQTASTKVSTFSCYPTLLNKIAKGTAQWKRCWPLRKHLACLLMSFLFSQHLGTRVGETLWVSLLTFLENSLTANPPILWLLKSCHLLFRHVPWVCCRCSLWDWAPHAEVWLVMVFCSALSLLQRWRVKTTLACGH